MFKCRIWYPLFESQKAPECESTESAKALVTSDVVGVCKCLREFHRASLLGPLTGIARACLIAVPMSIQGG
jgi:hypothetical protein